MLRIRLLHWRGNAEVALGDFANAVESYTAMLTLPYPDRQTIHLIEAWTGLAQGHLGVGEIANAVACAEHVVPHLLANTLDGADYRFGLHLAIYNVLAAVDDPRAAEVLTNAVTQLSCAASQIESAALRVSYLRNVPANAALRQAVKVQQGKRDAVGHRQVSGYATSSFFNTGRPFLVSDTM